MQIYNYDHETKEFIESSEATVDPLDNENFLIPAYATSKAPLEDKEGFAVCFNEKIDDWEYKVDHRGESIYNIETKEAVEVDYIGPIKSGYTLQEPGEFDVWEDGAWVEDVEQKRRAYIAKVEELADQKHANAEKIIAGKDVSERKRERYKQRLKMITILNDANASEEDKQSARDALTLLAQSDGKSLEDYISVVLATGEMWERALNLFYGYIDSVANRMNALIESGRFDDVEAMLELVESIGRSEDGSELSAEETLVLVGQQVQDMLSRFTL